MKLFAYYLPQFHCIPENDEWWGKGFTEWTNVKKAKKLYKEHLQPKKPLNNNYYSLENIETLKWQQKLLKEYHVDGLIFYHYYFTGKKLLEKPAEMLLENKNIKIPFFFCWANHSWFRSWEGSKTLLLEQNYGDEKEWDKHFKYLLPFFKDERYEKKNNKPVFMIFKPFFEEKRKMFDFFEKKCIENGFDGICIIETFENYKSRKIESFFDKASYQTEFIHLREPGSVLNMYLKHFANLSKRVINKIKTELIKKDIKILKKYDGSKFFKFMKNYKIKNKKIIRGVFFEWDNTPRHGYRGYVITPPKKEEFLDYMETRKDDEYMFINAWNEWCEGMMLEPTEENEYKYLEWIKEWKEIVNR